METVYPNAPIEKVGKTANIIVVKARRWSILLYAVFLSAFMIAFFASFRLTLSDGLSDANSRTVSVRSISELSDAVRRGWIEQNAFSALSQNFLFRPVNYDGRIRKVSVLAGVPYRFEIVSKSGVSTFWAYVESGWTAFFEVFGSDGKPIAHATVAAGSEVEIPLPASLSGSVSIVSLSAKSVVEIDRFGAEFRYPDLAFEAYRSVSNAEERLGTYRPSQK